MAGSRAHDGEHRPGEGKTLVGSAAPTGIPKPGRHRREGFEDRIGSWVALDVPPAQATSSQHAAGFPGRVWFSHLPSFTALALCYGVGKLPDPLLIDSHNPARRQDTFQIPSAQQQPLAAPRQAPLDKCPTWVTSAWGANWDWWARGAGGGRCPCPLSLSYSHITGQIPGMNYQPKGQSKFSVALTRGCLVFVTLQGEHSSASLPDWLKTPG